MKELMKKKVNEITEEVFLNLVLEKMDERFGEAKKSISEEDVKNKVKEIHNSEIYGKNTVLTGIHKVLTDLRKKIIKADVIFDGFYIASIDQVNPRKETRTNRQSVYVVTSDYKELKELTLFGHGPTLIENGEKQRESIRLQPLKQYRFYCTYYEQYGTLTLSYAEELNGEVDKEKLWKFLEEKAIKPEDIGEEHLYKTVVLKANVRYMTNLGIISEGPDNKPTVVGNYPVISPRDDPDHPNEPSFVGRVKLVREKNYDETDEDVNYTEIVFYPPQLATTFVCLKDFKDYLEQDNIIEYDPELQKDIISDVLAFEENNYLFIGKVTQRNKDPNKNIIWVKVVGAFMTNDRTFTNALEGVTVEPMNFEFTSNKNVETENIDDERLSALKEVLHSPSIKMLGPTNFDELLERIQPLVPWINESYRSVVNSILAEDGRLL